MNRSLILKDIATSNSSALDVVGRGINENTTTLKDLQMQMQRFDRLFHSI